MLALLATLINQDPPNYESISAVKGSLSISTSPPFQSVQLGEIFTQTVTIYDSDLFAAQPDKIRITLGTAHECKIVKSINSGELIAVNVNSTDNHKTVYKFVIRAHSSPGEYSDVFSGQDNTKSLVRRDRPSPPSSNLVKIVTSK